MTTEPPRPYRIAVVCLGNICRSPVADVVLNAQLAEAGLDGVVTVESGGTAGYHVGRPMDPRAAAALEEAGYDPTRHRARRFTPSWFERLDLVLAMDGSNLADLASMAHAAGVDTPIRMFREFDPEASLDHDVPDPYHGDASDFAATVRTAARTGAHIVSILSEEKCL